MLPAASLGGRISVKEAHGSDPGSSQNLFFIKMLCAPGYQGVKLICLWECVCLERTIRYFVSFKIILRARLSVSAPALYCRLQKPGQEKRPFALLGRALIHVPWTEVFLMPDPQQFASWRKQTGLILNTSFVKTWSYPPGGRYCCRVQLLLQLLSNRSQ